MGRRRIVIIGSGNVATHLAQALDAVCDVVQVYSRNIDNARLLAGSLAHAEAIDDIASVDLYAHCYIISVKDDAIAAIASSMPKVEGVVMHTSGSIGMEVLEGTSDRIGVLYPLQTFSKDVAVDMAAVPLFIEASDSQVYDDIASLARSISSHIHAADSAQRTVIHIAAVFGCNFLNHMLDIASQILSEHGYTLDILHPLIDVTVDKAMRIGPHKAQTGPAARGDIGVIDKHKAALTADRRLIYDVLSQHIMAKGESGHESR